ncbi:MAG: SdrD B-like domain-containing protein [Ardenticatenaceae bacterium]
MTFLSNLSKQAHRWALFCLIALFSTLLSSSALTAAPSLADQSSQSVTITGPTSGTATWGQSVEYHIEFSGVTLTGGIHYTPPAGFTVTETDPQHDDPIPGEESMFGWFGNSAISSSGTIKITGVYNAEPCAAGDMEHVAFRYDSHPDPNPGGEDVGNLETSVITTLSCTLPGTVRGTVFDDVNGNQVLDAGEAGISGVEILLASTAPQRSTTTDANGNYEFNNVPPGPHTVVETDPSGYLSTTPNSVAVLVFESQTATANFGDWQAGSVRGTVIDDTNGNGSPDGGESGIAGVSITLSGGSSDVTTTTDADGNYDFANVTPGDYTVIESDPDGYRSTTPNQVPVTVLSAGEVVVDFADQEELPGTVRGVVFNDLNGNRVQDGGETGIPDVTITLSNGSSNTVTTDANGNYEFTEVEPGDYTVTAPVLAGSSSTTPRTVTVVVASGGNPTANFGYQPAGRISGTAFEDANGNGTQDGGEAGIANVSITLDGQDRSTTTDANGNYEFTNVDEGNYTVTANPVSGYSGPTPNSHSVSVLPGSSATANFAYQAEGTVSGLLFEDRNGNGSQDAGEPGLSGLEVQLVNGSTATATTDADGNYQFTGVQAGNYTVVAPQAAGYSGPTPASRAIAVPAGGSATASFTYQSRGTISGVVTNDANANGSQDDGEAGIEGVFVTLIDDENGNRSAMTDADGNYQFTQVDQGNYTVIVDEVAGFFSTTPRSRAVSVAASGSATANFGFQPSGTVGGIVFYDLNGNGIQDAGEVGIGGVSIELLTAGTRIPTEVTTTEGDGTYLFTEVEARSYTVSASNPPGLFPISPNNVTISVPANGSATAHFAYQQEGTVSGVVYHDENGNQTQDAGELGIGGVTITLRNVDSGSQETAETASNGSYSFSGVQPGSYAVQESDPDGYSSSTSNIVSVSVAGIGSATANFGDQPEGTLSGTTFNDQDGSGSLDSNEPAIGGVTVELRRDGSVIDSTSSASNGGYSFSGVTAGEYQVCTAEVSGFVRTTADCRAITLSGGSATANFGFQEAGSISGTAFKDTNGNGVRDSGELGIGGVVVQLFDQSGTEVGSAATSGDGSYVFSNIIPRTYELCVSTPLGFSETNTTCQTITLTGGNSVTANFGFQQNSSIGGKVFNDTNGNGLFDAGELGIGGVTVRLFDAAGNVEETTTSGDGTYLFEGVTGGFYGVIETDPSGYSSTSANTKQINLPTGGSATANFADQRVATIGGLVFEDLDGNGTRSANEPGIGGVTVALDGSDTTTAGDGSYVFESVTGLFHTVEETDPTGFASSTPNSVDVFLFPGGSGGANFGDQQVGTVSGLVFNDLNGNGSQNSGEPGISGATITLRASDGAEETTTTASNGSYSFNGVAEGAYTVEETDPPGYSSSTANSAAISVPAGGSATANFGDQQVGTISGVVFNDLNGDGEQNGGESPLGGVTITLINDQTGAERTTTTASNGGYSFADVVLGEPHTVVESNPDGYYSTTPDVRGIFVPPSGGATANFGDVSAGTVSGVLYQDSNGNGQRDDNESGLGGVRLELRSQGDPVAVLSNGDGSYSFDNVVSGAYTVAVSQGPSGFISTTPDSQAISVPEGGSATADFGYQQSGIVSGVVFNDKNGNGVQDGGEEGIGGVQLSLINGETRTTMSAGNGFYIFVNVAPGDYSVVEEDPAGYTSTTSNSRAISVADGGSATATFGDQQKGTVCGVVFNDLNGNGIQDEGEVGIGGATVQLIVDGETRTTSTAGDGYCFTDLPVGTYTVIEIDPEGFVSSTTNVRDVSIGADGSATANFGDQQLGTLSGTIYNDLNGNGVFDAGEPGISGVTVTLENGDSTTTVNSGSYLFSDLTPGNHTVVASDPTGFVSSTPNSQIVSVPATGSATANFGYQQIGTVNGVVYDDQNGNGTRDSGEPGMSGVTVQLINGETRTTTTAGDGSYSFNGVSEGVYTVQETNPAGFVSTTPDSITVSVPAGGSATANFGDQATGTVGGIVFNDLNNDGVWQPGELGIGDVTVELRSDTETITTQSAGNGVYQFSGVSAGTYTVHEIDPAGFLSSSSNTVTVLIGGNGSATTNFGDQRIGSVTGRVFNDINGNGTRDSSESGLGGVIVQLVSSVDTAQTRQTQTAGDGSYQFSEVEPQLYTAVEIDREGYTSTTPNDVAALVGNNGSASADFGDQQAGTIGGIVFNDLNGNGTQDTGEPGLAGALVELVDDNDEVVDSARTPGTGVYQFSGVSAARYTVRETDPAGFSSSTPNQVVIGIADDGGVVVNFGDVEAGSIVGQVCNDSNNNQTCEDNEPGLSDVTVELFQNGSLISTAQTTGGSFSFQNLSPGNYTVQVTDPDGFVSTSPNTVDVLLAGNENVSFGYRGSGTISGDAFFDLNGDALRDFFEFGMGAVSITLTDADGNQVATTQTSGMGNFEFAGLSSGTYTVEATPPPGLVNATPNPVTVNLQTTADVRFGFAIAGAVSGRVVARVNWTLGLPSWAWGGNGVPLRDVTIELYDSTRSTRLQSTTTGGDGTYSFTNLAPGSYWVHLVRPSYGISHWWYLGTRWKAVTVAPGSSAVANFNLTYDPCVVGVVYSDLNLDGAYNDGEPTLSGVRVRFKETDGTIVREVDTEGDGSYLFKDVDLGTYLVEVVPPEGWTAVTETSVSVALVEQDQGESVSFGLLNSGGGTRGPDGTPTSTLYGSVRDANGQPMAGISITLKDEQGNSVGQATTIANGSYSVRDIPTGRLSVDAALPAGYVGSTPNQRTVYLSADKGGVAHFVYAAQDSAIRGNVYRDSNANGQYDPNEVGIGGIGVQLVQNGTVVETITTTLRGDYNFALVAGMYDVVIVADPKDHVSTTPNTVRSWGPAEINFGDRILGVEAIRATRAGRRADSAFVAGTLYNDIDGSGTYEASERTLGGIVVTLRTLEGTEVMTATTTGDGQYAFQDVPAGVYQVVVADVDGFMPTSPTSSVISARAGSASAVNFGHRTVMADAGEGAIVGRIFNDLNSDQRFNGSSEATMSGISVKLLDLAGNVITDTSTSGDGSYALNNVPAGQYQLSLDVPSGFSATTTESLNVVVAEGQLTSVPFGLLGSDSVGGSVFFDLNGDTKRHVLERGAGGLSVSLRDSAGNEVAQTTTSINGDYLITGLEAGEYTVELSVPEGLEATSASQSNLQLRAGTGATRNFGLSSIGTISGIVYQDDDGDQMLDDTEAGLSGVEVSLNSGSQTATTFAGGVYQFLNLSAGSYTVTESDPTGFISTENQSTVTLSGNDSGAANFGDQPNGRIGGTVYYDLGQDRNPGFGGAQVQLQDADGTVVQSVNARANGTYAFNNLDAGRYTVVVTLPTDFFATTPEQVNVTLADPGSQAVNFGLSEQDQPPGTTIFLPIMHK